jgi:Cyclic nucleotide-binding domain
LRQYTWLARSKPNLLLLTAWGLSYAGDLAAFTAASVYAYRAGGAGFVAVLGLLKALSGAFLVPLVTSGSDRVRRERLLIATVVPRALLLGVATAVMTGGGQGVLVVVLVGLEGGLASAFRQVQAALLPWLARTPDELTSANTAASMLQSAAMVGGPAIAAGLLAIGTAQVAMLAACGFVAVAAVLLVGVRPLSSPAPAQAAGRLKQLKLDMVAGFDAGVRQRKAVALVVPAAGQTFARGVLNVLTVVIALELFSLGSAAVGWLAAVLGVGGLLCGPLTTILVRGQRVARSFAAGVAGWGVPMILLAFAHAPYWPYLMFGLIGAANVFGDVGVYSSLQQVIPPRLMGRALGVRRGLLLLSMGLGSAVTPLLIDAWGGRGTLIATGLLVVVLAAAFLPRLTAIDARISAPGPDLALLRQVSFFRPLPFATVEHLASELQSATYEPGDEIITEGEPGERFYIIAEGRARASKDGEPLREMGAGESFGEIALLRRIPRTAAVTAISRTEVRTLGREEFLAAVTGNPESGQNAEEVVSTRLQAR